MKIAIIFDNFGPYHLARLRAAARVADVLGVEVAASSAEYAWKRETESGKQKTESGDEFQISDVKTVTLLERGTSRGISSRELAARLNRALEDFQPQAVFIPGWSSRMAFIALSWCARNGVPVVTMSESTEWDEARTGWKEWMKRRIVGLCSAALVGGRPHKDYMVKLGMPAERVFLGYDAVDNDYFAQSAKEVRRKFGLPDKYFLASARFIKKKNLPRLIQAYARYRELAEMEVGSWKLEVGGENSAIGNRQSAISNLVLLLDGAMCSSLRSQVSSINLGNSVHLPGFKQYPDLPAYYAHAGAFIHASTTEQWGLVVNEAMASGLPVLVSNRCGCAADLVQEGVNGFTFDPLNVEQLAQLMFQVSGFRFQVSEFGAASARIIAGWGPERFASGLMQAAECALRAGPVKPDLLQRTILNALLKK